MERQQGNGIYALLGAAAVVVVAALVGVLVWEKPSANGSNGQSASVPVIEGKPATKNGSGGKTAPETGKGTASGDKNAAADKPKDAPKGKPVDSNGKPLTDKPAGGSLSDKPQKDASGKPEKLPTEAKSGADTVQGGGTPLANHATSASGQGATAPGHDATKDVPAAVQLSDSSPVPSAGIPAIGKPDVKTVYPSFDHVRVEPNGENVFAGRVVAGATVEMMRDGQVYARAVADTSGLFALSAPPLPIGASQIYLQSIAPDGARVSSRDSVTVVINADKTRRPLVALTSPDKPTVVLSNPDSPDGRKPEGNDASAGGKPQNVARPQVQISSVEARDGGRLFVSGVAAPGAAVKLYLNGTMVAPGGADSDGKLSFTIARGMAAGSYLVRLDDVDPVSGQVKSRAEVTFMLPDIAAYQAGAGDGGVAEPPSATTAGGGMRKATVNRGDSLWSISERYYGSGYLYLEVYDANMRKIKDPNTIYPGQVLTLPPLEMPKDK